MRVTRGHANNRRSHHSLKGIRLSKCSNCQEMHERHKICLNCGHYRGKAILNKEIKLENKKEEKTIETTEENK